MDRVINTPVTDEVIESLHAGDRLLITGSHLHGPRCRSQEVGGADRQG